ASETQKSSAPGMLLLSMTKETLINTIHHDLDTPYRVIGVNNHMGSKFSQDSNAMRVFLKEIKARDLFFIDSLTTANSTGYSVARDLGIKTAKRDIFLDNDQNPTQILVQIGRLIKLAQRHGSAIGIGHPYPTTLAALRSAATRLSQDVVMVPVHELVN
ncbi:MAG: divergent polysaccharide deacetylase family protein, partial [Desulfobulbaceae bacterium]|nr:divergent polysaccharide deacetylase family protein [Desulfobulbaceae bacterium]